MEQLLGCVNYLSRYLPKLAEAVAPLRILIEKSVPFYWQSQQQQSFEQVKKLVTTTPVLKFYNAEEEVTIQCDTSEKGLGATLLQNGQPVTFASRALSKTEQRLMLKLKKSVCQFCLHVRDLTTIYIAGPW